MSRSGALIQLKTDRPENVPLLGSPVQVDIEFPANELFGMKWLHCRGSVVRTFWSRGELPQMAIDIVHIEFRKAKPAVVEMNPRPVVTEAGRKLQ